MITTIAKDLISSRVVVVHPEQRLSDVVGPLRQARAQYCAVVNDDTHAFEGIVRLDDVAASNTGQRIFADLIGEMPWISVAENASADEVLAILSTDKTALVAVLRPDGYYLGIITMESAWGWLVQSQASRQSWLEQIFEEQRLLADFLEKKIEQRTASLRAALEEFRSTSAQLSHDVGGPLRTIKSFVEMLSNGECGVLNEEGRNYVDRIFRAATKVETLAVEVLGRAREAGKAAPAALHSVNLNEVLDDAIELSNALLQERDAVVIHIDALHAVKGRYVPLLQIMSNLLANAVKYVPVDRKPEVRIWSEEVDGQVLLCVKDNGRGIGAADTETVFKPFMRLEKDRVAGAGLGLSIARDAVRDLGGSILLESEEGIGSQFTVVLQPVGE